MDKPSFKLESFEGPLDLLLQLIQKHKLDIYDIEISKLLEQYMLYINAMKSENLDIASEFLEMAARLVHIKTVALLPKHEESEEDLKAELTGELLEYQACREMADKLNARSLYGKQFEREPQKIPVDQTYTRQHNADELILAYGAVLGKAKRKLPPPVSTFKEIVASRMVSVESRVIVILKRLYKRKAVAYKEFYQTKDRSELVATFLAMLELIKVKRITVSDDNSTVYFDRDNA